MKKLDVAAAGVRLFVGRVTGARRAGRSRVGYRLIAR
jgi:hypothetical protein